jgi:hypothetical protein
MKSFFVNFVFTFAVALLVSAVVTFIWNVVTEGVFSVDWTTSFRLAVIIGVAFALRDAFGSRKKAQR